MQCEHCGERPAVIKLTQVEQDTKTTVHLCEQCAAERGIETSSAVSKSPLGDFLASMGKGVPTGEVLPDDTAPCDFCSGTLRDFRETGRLGCAHCYAAFETHLRDLLRRLHGSSQHVGKVYLSAKAPPGGDDAGRVLDGLRQDLRRAVDAEDFELAAQIRDRIRVLE